MDTAELLTLAKSALGKAYAPYSKFPVGAVLVADDGSVFCGCNVENISFGLTICAERNALCAAVAAGYRRFLKIVVLADSKHPVTPCGACRQVLAEFEPGLEIISANFQGETFRSDLSELLPRPRAGILNQ